MIRVVRHYIIQIGQALYPSKCNRMERAFGVNEHQFFVMGRIDAFGIASNDDNNVSVGLVVVWVGIG